MTISFPQFGAASITANPLKALNFGQAPQGNAAIDSTQAVDEFVPSSAAAVAPQGLPVQFAGSFATNFSFSDKPWTEAQGDALLVPAYQGKQHLAVKGQLAGLNDTVGGVIGDLYQDDEFGGATGQSAFVRTRGGDGLSYKKIGLLGLGARKDIKAGKLEEAVTAALANPQLAKASNLAVALPSGNSKLSADAAVQEVLRAVDGVTYRSLEAIDGSTRDVEAVTFHNAAEGTPYTAEQFEAALARHQIVSKAVGLAKDLANAPHNHLNAVQFAEKAIEVAASLPNVTAEVQDENWVRENMPAFYAVGKGAIQTDPPRFIKMTYKSPGKVKNRVALLGKSIMYDTGGVQDKAVHMNGMNKDMTGGAYAMAIIQALGELQPEGIEVSVYLPACTNADGPWAYKPSDILDTAAVDAKGNGKKIEVGHTDAEGRVTLYDAAALAARDGFKNIIAIATLTGDAVNRSPGQVALVSTESNATLRDAIKKASEAEGEPFKEFPLEDKHFEANKCKHGNAHIRNISNDPKAGGLETAGAFIQDGLPGGNKDIRFVHLDIAPVMVENYMADPETGATGIGVRTVLNYILSQAK